MCPLIYLISASPPCGPEYPTSQVESKMLALHELDLVGPILHLLGNKESRAAFSPIELCVFPQLPLISFLPGFVSLHVTCGSGPSSFSNCHISSFHTPSLPEHMKEKDSNLGSGSGEAEILLRHFSLAFLSTLHLGLLAAGSSSCYRGFESRGQLLECGGTAGMVTGKEVVSKGERQRGAWRYVRPGCALREKARDGAA